MPLLVYFLRLQSSRKLEWKDVLKIIIFSSIAWGAGYVAVWVTKWVIVDVLYNKGLIKTVLEQFKYRSYGDSVATYSDTLYRNFLLSMGAPIAFILFMVIESIVEFIICIVKKKVIRQNLVDALPYAIIMIMPFVWYLLLMNHSYNHAFFTYRDLLLFYIALPLLLQKIVEKEKDIKQLEEKK